MMASSGWTGQGAFRGGVLPLAPPPCRRYSSAAERYPANSCAANSRTPSARLPSICSPTVRITKDGPEQMQAGSSADACFAESCPVCTACAAAEAAGAKPPSAPMSSTPPALLARTPMSRAAGLNSTPSHSPAPLCISRAETIKNGNSDTSSGPPHSCSPCRRVSAQRPGAANTSTAVASASTRNVIRRIFSLRFISPPSPSIYM